jgi:hypothetical protein
MELSPWIADQLSQPFGESLRRLREECKVTSLLFTVNVKDFAADERRDPRLQDAHPLRGFHLRQLPRIENGIQRHRQPDLCLSLIGILQPQVGTGAEALRFLRC